MSQRIARYALLGLALSTGALLLLLLFSWNPGHKDHYAVIAEDSPTLAQQAADLYHLLDDAHLNARDLTAQEMFNARTWLGSIQRISCHDLALVRGVRDMIEAYTMLQTYHSTSQRERYESDFQQAKRTYEEALSGSGSVPDCHQT